MTTTTDYYKEGNYHRRKGDYQSAMNCYNKAVSIDPDSPAAVARQMLADQFAFFHKDYYNP